MGWWLTGLVVCAALHAQGPVARSAAVPGQDLSQGCPPGRVVVGALAVSRRQAGAALHGRAGGKAHRGNSFASSRARSRRRWAAAR